MQLQGVLHRVFEEEQPTATFRKRAFVVRTADNPQYPQYVQFQLIQDKTSLIEGFGEGDEVMVNFDIRGREWTSPKGEVKYFNSLDVWRIERASAGSSPAPAAGGSGHAQNAQASTPPPPPPPLNQDGGDVQLDDLPF